MLGGAPYAAAGANGRALVVGGGLAFDAGAVVTGGALAGGAGATLEDGAGSLVLAGGAGSMIDGAPEGVWGGVAAGAAGAP
jgi:hypothetical protein